MKEGAPAAIKLLMETDWEFVFSSIMLMKWWLAVKMLSWIYLAYNIILPVFHYLFFLFPLPPFSAEYNLFSLDKLILATPAVLFLNRENIRDFYRNIKAIDLLIIDLRWFYNEFKGARLEA